MADPDSFQRARALKDAAQHNIAILPRDPSPPLSPPPASLEDTPILGLREQGASWADITGMKAEGGRLVLTTGAGETGLADAAQRVRQRGRDFGNARVHAAVLKVFLNVCFRSGAWGIVRPLPTGLETIMQLRSRASRQILNSSPEQTQ